ncbi:hypothetical protein P4O66_009358 [Electrophorus voltai]|uniref:APCDD1 domain-containing protein n=1 Tax=Electrophorus voltai TaxID=2609070 RepID=A0AAD8ZDA8_9TELE|nr:hypothetical protein P4O66_009358 [Electrophorus voltai]
MYSYLISELGCRVHNIPCEVLHGPLTLKYQGSNLWDVPTSHLHPSTNFSSKLFWEPQCQTQLRHLQDRTRITATIPPRCEVRAGPEFLTRSYIFYPTRLFKAFQYYYCDSNCHVPAYSLIIQGKLRLRQASWITHGATEAEHNLQKVTLVIHNQWAAHRLETRLPSSCLRLGSGVQLVPSKLYELFNAKAKRDCLGALHFSMMELDLLRLEIQYHPLRQPSKELFLGDVHTDQNQRAHYRPTGYQQPLQNTMHHIHPCPVCALMYQSTEQSPPILPPSWSIPLNLNGHWISQRCEARPAVLFLTRLFVFNEEHHTWEGTYHHYSDPMCNHRTFTLVASGHYARMEPSSKVQGATELVFKVIRAKVTMFEQTMLQMLNSSEEGSCGQAGGWEPGAEQDITWTAGCGMLGILLPHKEYELFKMEKDHKNRSLLLIGERPTDGSSPDRPVKRPTSFQTPMVQCSPDTAVPQHYSSRSDVSTGPEVSSAIIHHSVFSIFLMSLLSMWYWCILVYT